MKAYLKFCIFGLLAIGGPSYGQAFNCGDEDSTLPYAKLCGNSEIFEFKLDKLNFDKERLTNNISTAFKFRSGNRAAMRASTVIVATDKPKLRGDAALAGKIPDRLLDIIRGGHVSREMLWDIISRTDFNFPDRVYDSKSDYGEFGLIAQVEIPAPQQKGRVTFFLDWDAFLTTPSHAPVDYTFITVIASLNNTSKYQIAHFQNSDFSQVNEGGYRMPASASQPVYSVPVEASDTGKVILNIFARAPEKKYQTENAKGQKKKSLGDQHLKIRLKRISAEVTY